MSLFFDNIVLVGYLLAWILTYLWYRRKGSQMDGGSIILLSYISYAVFSLLTFNMPESVQRYDYLPLQVFPFIYLWGMMLLALSPAIYLRSNPIGELPFLPMSLVKAICWFFVICGFASLPNIIENFGNGFLLLFVDSSAGLEAYKDSLDNALESGTKISNLQSILYNMLYDSCIFFFFYLLSVKRNRSVTLLICMLVALLVGLVNTVMQGQRGNVITALLTLVMSFFFFQKFLSTKLRRVARYIGMVLLVLIMLPIVAITISRFTAKNASGVQNSLTWYIGQGNLYFNSYAMDDGGIRNGDRVFNLAKRLIDPDTPANYIERRDVYNYLTIGDEVFSTFVGDFVIDLGPVMASVVFLLFNGLVLMLVRRRGGQYECYQLLLIYMTMCICVQGGMTLFSYADTGGLKLIAFMLIYFLLIMHKYLRNKYPKKV